MAPATPTLTQTMLPRSTVTRSTPTPSATPPSATSQAGLSLAELYAPVADGLRCVVDVIDREIDSESPVVRELCRVVQRYRGKMLRPAILLLTADCFGEVTEDHYTLAAVLELIHLASLVHDDVLDESEVRRRQPTVNAMSGNETAVMLGDWLFSHAFSLSSKLDSAFARHKIGLTTHAVCEGELMQLHHRGNFDLSENEYFEIIHRKTATLTGACAALGAQQAGASDVLVAVAEECGTSAGMAFQIIDDVLDLVGAERAMGKSLGRDLAMGKLTLPVIHCLSGAEPKTRAAIITLLRTNEYDARAQIAAMLQEHGSIDYAAAVANRFAQNALTALEALPDSPARTSLAGVTEFILRRDA